MPDSMSRRDFLKTTGIIAAAIGVALCGGTTLAATVRSEIEKPSLTLGEETMSNRVLIAYATKTGSTAEIATRIGEIFAEKGFSVDVKPAKEVKDVSPYSTVLVGSGIRVGQMMGDAMKFITKNQAALKEKHFSVFFGCMVLKDYTPEKIEEVSVYLNPVRDLVQPEYEGMFAGVIDPAKMTLVERMMMKVMKVPQGDFRNWTAIESWASEVEVM
ncbi:MAG: twin-arginine translocation signal domain-containing protein [Anaerolineaceae bacterium]|nr:twin-arginine translocation signal domain-containing protein [Anaerolineaceae bacterium]